MDERQDGMDLLSAIPVAELGQLRRRVVFLEAALAQLLRERGQLREWFTASELARLALPGLPRTRSGVAMMARARGWQAKLTMGRGGERHVYHFASLPRRAFEGMIDLVLRSAPPEGAGQVPALPPAPIAPRMPTTPPWVLPLMRMVRGERLPLDVAVQRLPDRVGARMACPSLDEAMAVLRSLGLLAG